MCWVEMEKNMKDQYGFNYYHNLAAEWFLAATEAASRGYLHLAKCFEQFGHEATTKQSECI